jgi:hypothetical protein
MWTRPGQHALDRTRRRSSLGTKASLSDGSLSIQASYFEVVVPWSPRSLRVASIRRCWAALVRDADRRDRLPVPSARWRRCNG